MTSRCALQERDSVTEKGDLESTRTVHKDPPETCSEFESIEQTLHRNRANNVRELWVRSKHVSAKRIITTESASEDDRCHKQELLKGKRRTLK